ncbi:MAG TPA: right-handed parallel beta-helix repeat-containing protein [Pyrinomonadaceae bacterium]|nr:right-handed parallel beta-helix repeat-containing protein [Pyrinomonadaceae bacterium]
MNKFRFTMTALAIMAFTLFVSSAAQAQATRTWVSGVGDDVNPCSRTAPCKTYAGAISKTAAGGEISTLDPGGFGAVTITKSMTIEGTKGQGYGSILASGTNGVVVNDSLSATPNTAIVVLRNLSINGAGSTKGTNGVRFTAGKAVHVEDCQINNFGTGTGRGIDITLTAGITGGQRVVVRDTIIKQNTGDGIFASNSNALGVQIYVENSLVSQNNNGITAGTNSRFIVKNSSFTGNTTTAIGAGAGSLGVELEGTLMSNSTNGLALVAGTSRISNCRITANTNGINFAGGTLITYGDNKLDGNANEAVGGAIPAPINKK